MTTVETRSIALQGLDARLIQVTATAVPQVGTFQIEGVSEASARETRVRVRAALQQIGVDVDARGVAVQFAPADLANGGSFDIAVAVAVLGAFGRLKPSAFKETVFLGALSLDGAIRPVRGVLPALRGASALGVSLAILPMANAREAVCEPVVGALAVAHIRELVRYLDEGAPLVEVGHRPRFETTPAPGDADLGELRGLYAGRRALEIAAAGGHHLLMMGLPGSGKTLLARRLPTILPPLTIDEALVVTAIQSVAGLVRGDQRLRAARPFRAPHHTVSGAGLAGGGDPARPGEVSLAHHGCLFLDDLLEIRGAVLDTLRAPLASGQVTLYRARRCITFPARPLIVAAVNPCPCGFGDAGSRRCVCSAERIRMYRGRAPGWLVNRFDLRVDLPSGDRAPLPSGAPGESSGEVQKRVIAARAAQTERARSEGGAALNAQLDARDIEQFAALDAAGVAVLGKAAEHVGLSVKDRDRVLRVARTIADLDGSEAVRAPHVAEAVNAALLPLLGSPAEGGA
jgi:magnesium chelatase family protein